MKRRDFLATTISCLLVSKINYAEDLSSQEAKIAKVLYYGFVAKVSCDIQMSNMKYDFTTCVVHIHDDIHIQKYSQTGCYCWIDIKDFLGKTYVLSNSISWETYKMPNFSMKKCIDIFNRFMKYDFLKNDFSINYTVYSQEAMKEIDGLL